MSVDVFGLLSVDALGPLLPGLPFAAALIGFVLPRSARSLAATLGIAGAGGALLVAVLLLARFAEPYETSVRLVDFGGLPVGFGVRVDWAAVYVALAVGVVALAVQVYSVAYLAPARDPGGLTAAPHPSAPLAADERYPPYAAQVSLFTAAMLLVVVAGDLIVLLVGWEVMGICSYLLIGHDRRLPEAPGAAVKAFLVTRTGDVGFLLGIALLGVTVGSFRIGEVLGAVVAGDVPATRLALAALLLLAGVAGKSALFPLHTWLPDAMAGPTPISALIHAATMVAAGVYLVARLLPVFTVGGALPVLGVIAAVTMLLGALAATAQDDIKRVLAWSTVSQLAYMAGALAVGAAGPALFHLLTHAAFKALLFLGAGSVIHAVGSNLMSRMGGLRGSMPATFWSMTIGLGALIGLPPLAGFWSKEAILATAAEEHGWVAVLVYAAGLATVVLTAWYATRLWLRTFFGAPRSAEASHGHEPAPAMRWPVMLLAIPSALLGFAAFADAFGDRLAGEPVVPAGAQVARAAVELVHLGSALVPPLLGLAVGVLGAWAVWRRDPAADPARVLGPLRPLFANAFYLDSVQDAVVVRPVTALARLTRRGDESIVDGAVEGTGRGALGLGRRLAAAHRSGLPRAATAVLAGALLIGAAAAVIGGYL